MSTFNYATISMTMTNPRMTISFPETQGMEQTKFRNQFEKYIKEAPNGKITINKAHREWVLETLRCLYDGVWEDREYSTRGICNKRCEDAQEDECVCSCKGEFHQGGGEWKYTIGEVLIGERQVTRVTRFYDSYNFSCYMTILPYNHPVRQLQPLAPASEELF